MIPADRVVREKEVSEFLADIRERLDDGAHMAVVVLATNVEDEGHPFIETETMSFGSPSLLEVYGLLESGKLAMNDPDPE